MTDLSSESEVALSSLITKQVNATLQKGSLVSSILALSSSAFLFIAMKSGYVAEIDVPILWTLLGGIYSFCVYILAKFNRIHGLLTYLVMTGFVSIPTVIYILAFFLLPAGAATYINGPAGYLYFFLIIISGFACKRKRENSN